MSCTDCCICCTEKSDLWPLHKKLSSGHFCSQKNAAALVEHCFNIKIVTREISYFMCSSCVSKLLQSCVLRDQLVHHLNSAEEQKDKSGIKQENDVEDIVLEPFQLCNFNMKKEYTAGTSTECKGQYEDSKKFDDSSDDNTYMPNCETLIEQKPRRKATNDNICDVTKSIIRSRGTKKKMLDENKSTIFCRIKIHPETNSDLNETPVGTFKSANVNKVSKHERRKAMHQNYVKKDKVKTKTENSRVKDDFESLLLNCKDFGIFSWHRSKYKCLVCGEYFSDKTFFKTHAMKHTSEDFNKVCPKGNFYDVPDIKVDISSMKCRHCGESVTKLDAFRSHLSVSHNIKSDDFLRRILPFNLTEDELKCGVCDKAFINMWTLNIHMNEHSTNYICPHCGKFFVTFNRMRGHVNQTHVTGTFKCSHCDETFESPAKRGYHTTSVHRTVKHLCQYCPESFKAFEHKIRHLAEVHNKELRRYKCDSCPAAYITTKNLNTHIRNVHLQERNFACSECGVAFFSRRELQDHMVKHTGERQFECKICQKAFGRKRNLVQHMKVHKK